MEEREIPTIISCPMCFFQCELQEQLIKHIVRFHKHDPAFRVKCNQCGCGATFHKWKSFKQHIRRNHSGDFENVDNPEDINNPENVNDIFYDNAQDEYQDNCVGEYLNIKKIID
ncbi:hypothetical protein ALC57_00079 [Trachymyrmex cornetzi]|uniref:C2H2-type domain-containing protein n=1 Tax=Trachymyrmex cornetzi TaxID=471704 RepID=A0A151K2Y6_9HYME|nr:hypothetical protein ALC57_00079 [Trachymyrmex cornetzi]